MRLIDCYRYRRRGQGAESLPEIEEHVSASRLYDLLVYDQRREPIERIQLFVR